MFKKKEIIKSFTYGPHAWEEICKLAKRENETPEHLLTRAQAIGIVCIKFNKNNIKDV